MAQDNEIRLSISAEADESSIARAKRSLDGLEGSVKDVADEIKKAGRVGDFSEVVDGARKAERAVDSLADSAREAGRELNFAVDAANDRFQRVSNQVSLAGDAESALNTLGGAAGAFGGGGAQQALGAGAEIFATVEALPRLKEALGAFPQVAGAAAQALGTTTTNLAGLGVALAALALVTKIAQDAQAQRTKEAQGSVAALLNANDLERLSTEDLIAAQAQYRSELQNQQEDLATAKGALERFQEALGFLGNIFAELGNLFGVSGTELGVLRGEITRLSGSTSELEGNIRNTERILAERGVTEDQISSATENTTQSLDVAAQAQQQFASILNQAQSATVQTTSTTQQRITSERQYQTALQQTSVVARQSSAEQRRAANREAGAADRARAQERRQRISDTIARVRERQQAEREETTQAAEERGNVLRDFYNREQDELIRHQKSLEDIRLNAQRAEQDALRSGDIFAIRDIRERAGQQLGDATRDFQFDAGMRVRDFGNSNPNMTFNITNADPQAVAYQIQRQLAGTLR